MRQNKATAGRRRGRNGCVAEAVEPRVLLSHGRLHAYAPRVSIPHVAKVPAGTAALTASPVAVVGGGPWATTPIHPLTNAVAPFAPAQVRHFYGFDGLAFNGLVGDGSGQTIAIVDAFEQPNIASDLATFDARFGLPAPPSFRVVGQAGGTPPSGPGATYDFGWAIEASLDVEWTHAIAPAAKIILVEADTNNLGDLYAGINYARSVAGVSVVSTSFGSGEFGGEQSYDSYFTTPAGHNGVTFVASTGDNGASDTDYPATSPNVVAAGGTSIVTADANASYGSETAWSGGGGNTSAYESQPAYQTNAGLSAYGARAAPDVSFLADPNTGVYLYDTSSTGGGGYYKAGGTSLSAPCIAGLVAVADQFRVANGLGTYDGATQTLPRLYQLFGTQQANAPTYAADFHDVTGGSNGLAAGVGYDLATGIGTPIAAAFVPDLANVAATVAGRAFEDDNANNVFDGTDAPLVGTVLYLDANNDGVHQAVEPTAVTAADGTFTFTGLAPGTATAVRVLSTSLIGGIPSAPSLSVPAAAGGTRTVNVGLFPTVYADAVAADAWTLRAAPPSATTLQVLLNGAVRYSAPTTLPTSLSFAFTGAGDGLTVDTTNGNPIPTGGVAETAGAAVNGDALAVIGSAGADAITFLAGSVAIGSRAVSFANVATLSVDPRGGTDALAVNAGVVTVPAVPAGGGFLARLFSALSVAAGATLRVNTAAAHADRAVLAVNAGGPSVAAGGTLDLGGNDLVARGGSVGSLTALLATGYAAGRWNGTGLASAAAAADPARGTALGVLANTFNGSALYPAFDGLTVSAADVLVKYTYYGDADLSGRINGADYVRADAGYSTALTGWSNGDFNYDGKVDGSDYTLIDNLFNTQAAIL